VKADAKRVADAVFVNASNSISCTTSNDCSFTSADLGKIAFGTNFGTDISILNPSSVVVPQGFICAITDSQHVTLGTTYPGCGTPDNATASCTPAAQNGVVTGCTFVWGSDDTTALLAVATQAYANCNSGGLGTTVQLPGGFSLVQKGLFNSSASACVLDAGSGWAGMAVLGVGQTTSGWFPTPNFDSTTCVGGPAGDLNGCFLSGASISPRFFTIWGAGQAAIGAGFNGKVGVIVQGVSASNTFVKDMNFLAWGATTTGFAGLKIEAQSGTIAQNLINDGFGNNPGCWIHGANFSTSYTFEGSSCNVNGTQNLLVDGGQFVSHGGGWTWTNTTGGNNAVLITGATTRAVFTADQFPYQIGTGAAALSVQAGANVVLQGVDFFISGNATGFAISNVSSTVHIQDSIVSCSGCTAVAGFTSGSTYAEGGNAFTGTINNGAGTSFFDSGVNTYNGTVTHLGNIFASASATGTACTTGNWALTSGWGTSSIASVTANGESHRCQVVITGAAGSASPVLTWTFPTAYQLQAPGSCQISFNGTLTGESTGAPSTTAVAFTFTGTPSAQTYRLDASCGP
jgi:hypothetical protein